MKSRTLQIAACLLILAPRASLAQEKKAAPEPAKQEAAASSWPAAAPKDVASLDAIVAAVYNVISGPAGDRDWNRFRSLFTPDGRLVPLVKKPDGTFTHRTLAVEDYAKNGAEYFRKEGFYENELARRTEQFGQLAVVFTTY